MSVSHTARSRSRRALQQTRSYRVDFAKFESTFPDFVFEWSAERGADELASAYEVHGLTLADFEGYRFTRLRQLQRLLDERRLDDGLRWLSQDEPVRASLGST